MAILGRTDNAGKKIMTNCLHEKTYWLKEPWPTGEAVEVCSNCSMSRAHWEWGESDWTMIKDLEVTSKSLQRQIDNIVKKVKKKRRYRLRNWLLKLIGRKR